jgi:hypothetical protein
LIHEEFKQYHTEIVDLDALIRSREERTMSLYRSMQQSNGALAPELIPRLEGGALLTASQTSF